MRTIALLLVSAACWGQWVNPYYLGLSAATSYGSANLTASNHRVLARFNTEASQIGGVVFRVGTVTAGGDLAVRLYALDSSGFPTGSPLASATVSVASVMFYTATWTPVAISPYSAYGIVFEYASYSGQSMAISSLSGLGTHQALATFNGTSWTNVNSNLIGFVLDGGLDILPEMNYVPLTRTGSQFNSSSTPNERGMACVFPFRARAVGVVFFGSSSLSNQYTVEVYRDGTNIASFQGRQWPSTSRFAVPATFDIEPGIEYIVAVRPSSTSNVGMNWWSYAANGVPSPYNDVRKLFGQGQCQTVYRTGSGSWTYDNTTIHGMNVIFVRN